MKPRTWVDRSKVNPWRVQRDGHHRVPPVALTFRSSQAHDNRHLALRSHGTAGPPLALITTSSSVVSSSSMRVAMLLASEEGTSGFVMEHADRIVSSSNAAAIVAGEQGCRNAQRCSQSPVPHSPSPRARASAGDPRIGRGLG